MVPKSTVSRQNWKTPYFLVREIILTLGFPIKIDMTARNVDECAPLLEPGAKESGLSENWSGYWNFYNPPFNVMKLWVNKAIQEFKKCGAKSVGVAPANIETKWAGRMIEAKATLIVLSPRVNFEGGKGSSAPHATMLMILGGETQYGDYGIFRHEMRTFCDKRLRP